MTNLFRSLVFVPGNNPRFLEKAKSLSGDIVCFDLEDSVPDKEKENAREMWKSFSALNIACKYWVNKANKWVLARSS